MITWNAAFEVPWESPWGAVNKLAWLNGSTRREALDALMGSRLSVCDARAAVQPYVDRWWMGSVSHSSSEGTRRFFAELAARFSSLCGPSCEWICLTAGLLNREPRFCPECMRKGYHSIFHQLDGVQDCPWHGLRLAQRCPSCNKCFEGSDRKDGFGLTCNHCSYCFVKSPSDIRMDKRTLERRLDDGKEIMRWLASTRKQVAHDLTHMIGGTFTRVGRGWVAVSAGAVGLAVLCEVQAFPFPKAATLPLPSGFRLFPPKIEESKGQTISFDEADRLMDEVFHQLLKGLGAHGDCFKSACEILDRHRSGRNIVAWHPRLCLRAYALYMMRIRCIEFMGELRRQPWITNHVLNITPDALRSDLRSSYFYELTGLESIRRTGISRYSPACDRAFLDVCRDPWTRALQSPALHGIAYEAVDNPRDLYCDDGRAIVDWLSPAGSIRRWKECKEAQKLAKAARRAENRRCHG